ncbi:MAG: TraR/DksA C4-type zinc finger protein [Candidatus Moraniibacteriota bacterium]
MGFDQSFVTEMERYLRARLASKTEILRQGGQQALVHSPADLVQIKQALSRIRNRSYGLCTACGTCIAAERLRIIPEAPLCTECARSVETH